MTINISEILAAIINFIILFLILRHFLFKPVTNIIETRQSEVENSLNHAQKEMEEANRLKSENELSLLKSKEEGKAIIEQYKTKAEKVSKDIIEEANKEAELILQRAKLEIKREKDKAQDEIKTATVDLAVLLSSKALQTSIHDEEHEKLIDEFISKVG